MSESRHSQRNAKASPPRRRVFLLTDLSRRNGRDLSATLDEAIESTFATWRLSIRHSADLSPEKIAKLPADALIVDGLDSDQFTAAQQSCRKLISIASESVAGIKSLVIDAYLAGAVAADILLRRGHRHFVAAHDENPQLLNGFVDEIAHAGLSANAVKLATGADSLPSATILTETSDHQSDGDNGGNSQNSATLICIGRRTTACDLIIAPSTSHLVAVLLEWLDHDCMTLPTIPPNPVDDKTVAGLPDAYGDLIISAVSSYIDDQLSRGKGCKVDDIARHFSLARRTLERRFRDIAKTSIHKEITRRQVARARQNLFEPGATPATAASAASYSSTRMLSINFRKLTGLSPRSYQRKKILSSM